MHRPIRYYRDEAEQPNAVQESHLFSTQMGTLSVDHV